jgi:CBS domain-containing protein
MTVLTLQAQTIQEIMTHNPVTIGLEATLHEVAARMMDVRIGALPVLDAEGFPAGIITQADIVRHEREHTRYSIGEWEVSETLIDSDTPEGRSLHVESGQFTTVEEIMTPWLWRVYPDTPMRAAIDLMLEKQIHHVCVTDKMGYVVGMVSTIDILKNLV